MITSITPRQDKLLYGWRDPVQPRPAATVILLRDGSDGLEILMTRRSLQASFAPGAYVFPGGRVDDADNTIAEKIIGAGDPEKLTDAAFAVAAIRESFEELGVLIARDSGNQFATQATINKMNRSQDESFADQLSSQQLSVDLSDVQWFSHWITDRDLPKRFDTRFFIARMPDGQEAVADEAEQFEPVWKNPALALAEHDKGEFAMIFPTIRTLRQLSRFANAAQVIEYCQSDEPMWVSSPRGGLRDEGIARFTEDELPFGELEMVTPDGRVEHRLDWQHEAVPLLKHVIRITAPNPGRMTGPGTNTYIIGEPGDYTVIDPGPNEPTHIERIAAIVGSDLRNIICTHSHPDHYPGAAPLRDLIGNADIPILGRRSGPDFNPAWAFEPDITLEDGDTVSCGNDTIVALHTPGHASNHVCLLLREDGLLFSGDHILNGSTTVIDHPDGNMLAYMTALERLGKETLSFILPAHGHVIGSPYAEIDRLIKHRLKRESKVIDALTRATDGTLDDLVLIAYDDVDKSLHPVAKRSLSAHLAKLVEEGRATQAEQSWQIA
jgi:glyoxylase-like metal-dependent hydrolase (beta-lactamase superfamily II)/8-oxo-dGTP pyrophosphatase MutT (NUDIX family)